MAAGFIGNTTQLLLFHGKSQSLTEIAFIGHAIFNQEIVSADTKRHRNGIKLTVANNHVVVVVARNGVIARVKVAILNQNVVAGADINAIKSTVDRYVFEGDIFTFENCMAPVGAVNEGVAFKIHILTSPNTNAVRTATIVFTLGIVNVGAIDV